MTSNQITVQRLTPVAIALLRVVVSYLFILHGTAKLFHVPHIAMFDALPLLSLGGVASLLETFGGLAILIGIAVRPIAFLLSGEMAFAYFIVHAPQGSVLLPLLNSGESAVLFCFIFLLLAAAGGGAWSLDSILWRNRLQDDETGSPQRR